MIYETPGGQQTIQDAANTLSCEAYRDFWLAWDTHSALNIKVGSGSVVGENTLATHIVTTPMHVGVLAFMSNDVESAGVKWDIAEHAGGF